MTLGFLRSQFIQHATHEALIWQERSYTYAEIIERLDHWLDFLEEQGVEPGASVAVEGDFSADGVALLVALIERRAIVVPLTSAVGSKKPEFLTIAEVEHLIRLEPQDGKCDYERLDMTLQHPLLIDLKQEGKPGLVLFSSGSTGKSKAAVHDFSILLEKFLVPRYAKRMIGFLAFDHIGGINTLLFSLANGGCLVLPKNRSPQAVVSAIERYRVQVLATSPTFLNLMLLSGVWREHNLSSLELITYGTEPMPEMTLKALTQALPHVTLQQTYGLTEVGILRSKSRSSDSLWVKVGGEGFATRVVDGMLEIKAKSAMLGYLNAPSPFKPDGWFQTFDLVEVDGDWLRILGRKSEIINIGGEKVYPSEIEGVLQLMPNVEEVVVKGEPNPLTGTIVKAIVKLTNPEPLESFRKRMRAFCKDKLSTFKIPQRVVFKDTALHSMRYKKDRQVE